MEMDEVFKNLPLAEQKKMLDHLAKLQDVRFLSSEEREKYDESIKAADDYYGVLMSYYMNGIDEGVAKGEARGSHHKSLEIAKKMMAKGMDENTIMEITGLTQEEIYLSSTCFIIIYIKMLAQSYDFISKPARDF